MKIERIAQIGYEAFRAYCESGLHASMQPWSALPDRVKDGFYDTVNEIAAELNPTPRFAHETWMNQRISDGWTYGVFKDGERKTHPCLVPFDELPPNEQEKDALWVAIVVALRDDQVNPLGEVAK